MQMTPRAEQPIIETRDLTIAFGGHVAVDHVTLKVEPFVLKSIIGPNGAGKTTLFNLMTGQYKPTEGKVFMGGRDITAWVSPREPAWALAVPFSSPEYSLF
jgi:branched-chain amino acid transport system ATP-binding protein